MRRSRTPRHRKSKSLMQPSAARVSAPERVSVSGTTKTGGKNGRAIQSQNSAAEGSTSLALMRACSSGQRSSCKRKESTHIRSIPLLDPFPQHDRRICRQSRQSLYPRLLPRYLLRPNPRQPPWRNRARRPWRPLVSYRGCKAEGQRAPTVYTRAPLSACEVVVRREGGDGEGGEACW